MVGPFPSGSWTFLAFRAASYDLPEDFILRVESGLDEETRESLAQGVRIVELLRRVIRWMAFAFGLGAALLFLGVIVLTSRRIPWIGGYLVVSGVACWIFALVAFLFGIAVSLAYRRDLHRVDAFVRAERGSSLARDLA